MTTIADAETQVREAREMLQRAEKTLEELKNYKPSNHPDVVIAKIKARGKDAALPNMRSQIEGQTAYIIIKLKPRGAAHFYPQWNWWDVLHEEGYEFYNVSAWIDETEVMYSRELCGGSD